MYVTFLTVDIEKLETNIVLVKVGQGITPEKMLKELESEKWPLLGLQWDKETLRLVMHRNITDKDMVNADASIVNSIHRLLKETVRK